MLKKICYLGENKDFSDRWLIKQLKCNFDVILVSPGDKKRIADSDYIINRLYASVYERYKKEDVSNLLNEFKRKKGSYIINSLGGFFLECDRIKQNIFFKSNGLSFAPTILLEDLKKDKKSLLFPVLLKNNNSGRNKTLKVINSYSDLVEEPVFNDKKQVAQSLVNDEICYRTEFIGDKTLTFPQNVRIRGDRLEFNVITAIIKAPLAFQKVKQIRSILKKIGVQSFSIEYFLVKNKEVIVDYNLSSNYKCFLIKEKGSLIRSAWLELLN